MKLPAKHFFKNICSKGLFAAFLLLGFFTFSGLSISTQTSRIVTQTTLVVRANVHLVKGFQYSSTQSQKVHEPGANSFLLPDILFLTRIHNNRVAVSLKHCPATSLNKSILSICLFKTIPQSGKNNPSLILG